MTSSAESESLLNCLTRLGWDASFGWPKAYRSAEVLPTSYLPYLMYFLSEPIFTSVGSTSGQGIISVVVACCVVATFFIQTDRQSDQ